MPKYHPQAELAPRDAVSQSILQEMQKTDHTHVYLDIRHIQKNDCTLVFQKSGKSAPPLELILPKT